ncbi:MAG: hypothetical protein IJ094_04710 [Bacilli bacterium]|nr:hypothetical protein [Bacilli bacterium]
MSNEELEIVSDLIFNSIVNSKISVYLKLELLNNLKLFLENYNENINVLRNHYKK